MREEGETLPESAPIGSSWESPRRSWPLPPLDRGWFGWAAILVASLLLMVWYGTQVARWQMKLAADAISNAIYSPPPPAPPAAPLPADSPAPPQSPPVQQQQPVGQQLQQQLPVEQQPQQQQQQQLQQKSQLPPQKQPPPQKGK
jgi:hypothetical protein